MKECHLRYCDHDHGRWVQPDNLAPAVHSVSRRTFVQQTALLAAGIHAIPDLTNGLRSVTSPKLQGRQLDPARVKRLTASLKGRVISPHDADYASSRVVFNRAFDKHPALIIRCASVDDIPRTIEFARTNELPLSVRSGGHNRAGMSICDDGVVLDMGSLSRIDVDAKHRTASAQGGALTVQLDAATRNFGLATTAAGCPTVGLAGLTLGGGLGFLMSKYGTACDNLLSADILTADGRLHTVSHDVNPDLFWAIRGGGGNFGIATALTYRLHPLTDVLGGVLVYAPGRTEMMLHAFAKFCATAPDEMTVVGILSRSEAGTQFQMIVCHAGEEKRGSELLASWRALGPIKDSVRMAPYAVIQGTVNPAAPAAHFQTNLFLPRLGDVEISSVAQAIDHAPMNVRAFIVPYYGAISRVGVRDTAFPLRETGFEMDLMSRWTTPAERPAGEAWVRALRQALRPYAHGTYVNQLGETSEELVRQAYGVNYARLAKLKRKYDPGNLFRSNQNVMPG